MEKDWWWCSKEKGYNGGSEGYVAKNLLGMFPRVVPGTYPGGEDSDSGSSGSSSASFSSYTMKDPESAVQLQQEEEERRVGSASSA